ncbi:MAG: glycoside hydrolase family 13 protein [Pleomorphochaeta sp.]
MDLKNYFDFNVAKNFITPLFPKDNEKVEIKLIAFNKVSNIYFNYKKNGNWERIVLNKYKEINDELSYYNTSFIINEDTLMYFTIEVENSFYYYSQLGLSIAFPSDIDCFKLLINIKAPEWVSGSTCYQIFPDRFKNGNKELGVKTDAYKFDNSFTKEMTFDQKPLDFENGKCLDFFNGDLLGIEKSLDYLKKIGINCIYLNPIGVSKTTHRYDCCDFFHVDPNLGGDEALISLIDKAHEKGIKIIVDISINHTGIEHPWFKKALEDKNSTEASYYYFEENGEITYWQNVKTLPQLNYNNQELRDIMYRDEKSVIKKFLKQPFNQDGWRFDVADEVGRKDDDQLNDEIWREVRKNIKEVNPTSYILGESWIDSSSHLKGDQWDATMNYIGCGRIIRRWLGEEDRFTCLDWGHLPRKVNDYSVKDLAIALKSQLKSLSSQMAQFQFNLIDSHDTPRLHNNKEVFDFNTYKGGIILMYTLPGMPSVYYGDEIKLDGEMGSVEMSRYPMNWDEKQWDKDFYNLYKTLGNFREEYYEVFNLGSFKVLDINDDLFILARYNEEKVIFSILNKCEKPINLDLDIKYLTIDKLEKSLFNTKVIDKEVSLKPKENTILVFNRL